MKVNKSHHKNQSTISRSMQDYRAYAILSSLVVGSAAFLFGLTYGLVCPAVQPDSTSAESGTSSDVKITASSAAIISISAPDSVELSISPDFDNSVFTTASATVSVSTNNAYGYTLTMGTTDTTALTHESGSYTIPTLSADTAATTFSSTSDTTTDNMWGYTLDGTTYTPLTTSDSPAAIKTTETTVSADTTTVTFGTKTTADQASGDYSNTVVFSATANPKPKTIHDITNMQEMTAEVCSNTTTPAATALTSFDEDGSHKGDTSYVPQTTLTDTRDSSTYTVRKLADGNCWMTQNLALGGSSSITLTSSDSDVKDSFTLSAQPSTSFSSSNYDVINYRISSTTDSSGNPYGAYYNWYTATAGTGKQSTTGSTFVSICPKGWTLPDSGSSSAQFNTLYTTYSSSYDNLDSVFSLVFAGSYSYSSLFYSGTGGNWWSNTADISSSDYAYFLRARKDSSDVSLDYTSNKYHGRSVRCVARSS